MRRRVSGAGVPPPDSHAADGLLQGLSIEPVISNGSDFEICAARLRPHPGSDPTATLSNSPRPADPG